MIFWGKIKYMRFPIQSRLFSTIINNVYTRQKPFT